MGKKKSGPRFRASNDVGIATKSTFNPKESRIKALATAADAYGGDEDDFHQNRDEVLFEDTGRGAIEMDDLSGDEEIFGLDLPNVDSEGDDEEDEGDDDDDEEFEEEEEAYPEPLEEPRGRFAKALPAISPTGSPAGSDAGNSSDEEETWAANTYHASRRAPGEPDSSDDEALDLEVEEARRLQKRSRAVLGGEDFGLGEEVEGEAVEEVRAAERTKARLEDAGEAVVAGEVGEMGEAEAIKFLVREKPETLALLDDFREAAERMQGVESNLEIVRQGDGEGNEHPALAIMELEHQALSTYLPSLAFYFSLLLAPTPPSADLVDRVLSRLSELREALATMEELDLTSGQLEDSDDEEESEEEVLYGDEDDGITASELWDLNGNQMDVDDEEDDSEDEEDDSEGSEEEEMEEGEESMALEDYDSEEEEAATTSMLGGLSDEELEALIADMQGDADAEMLIAKVRQVQRAKAGLPPLDEEDEDVEMDAPKKRSTKSEKKARKEAKAAALKDPLRLVPVLAPLVRKSALPAPTPTKRRATNDDFADPTSLSRTDAEEKAMKKHSLRFHVSQVHQKEMKRASGGKERIGGDDDLPRRSKERSRREVLKKQEHGGSKTGGDALDGADWGEEDGEAARGVRGSAGGDEGLEYYDLVKANREGEKRDKQDKYDGDRSAEKAALDEAADGSAAGPRGATRKILSNKGLQPKRAKVNRNPRVKKRLRYDKAVKKVATMKSVYKGGMSSLAGGEYSGEKSGITGKVVKSIRLSSK